MVVEDLQDAVDKMAKTLMDTTEMLYDAKALMEM